MLQSDAVCIIVVAMLFCLLCVLFFVKTTDFFSSWPSLYDNSIVHYFFIDSMYLYNFFCQFS